MHCSSQYNSRPSIPISRPSPDCLKPPKGNTQSIPRPLIPTCPVRSRRGDFQCLPIVVGEHTAGQSELGFVGDAHRIVHVVEGNDDHDGAEHLFLRDAHGVLDVGEDRRFDIPADVEARGPASSVHHDGTLVASGCHVVLDTLALPLRDERAEEGFGIERVADLQFGHFVGQPVDDLVVSTSGDEHAGQRRARLAIEEHARVDHRGNRAIEVDIVEEDRRRLAAELEAHPPDGRGTGSGNLLSRRGAAGERNAVDRRMRDEVRPRLPATGHDADDPGRQIGLFDSSRDRVNEDNGVSGDGLITSVQPATSAGAIFMRICMTGPFHGTIAATTPAGAWRTIAPPATPGLPGRSSS